MSLLWTDSFETGDRPPRECRSPVFKMEIHLVAWLRVHERAGDEWVIHEGIDDGRRTYSALMIHRGPDDPFYEHARMLGTEVLSRPASWLP